MLQRKRLSRNTTPKLARAFKAISKESRLKEYRRGLALGLQGCRVKLFKATAKAQIISGTMHRLAIVDNADAKALTDLVFAMLRHAMDAEKACEDYFRTLELTQLDDAELWAHWQNKHEAEVKQAVRS